MYETGDALWFFLLSHQRLITELKQCDKRILPKRLGVQGVRNYQNILSPLPYVELHRRLF